MVLQQLFSSNETLYYKVLYNHLVELLPIVYTVWNIPSSPSFILFLYSLFQQYLCPPPTPNFKHVSMYLYKGKLFLLYTRCKYLIGYFLIILQLHYKLDIKKASWHEKFTYLFGFRYITAHSWTSMSKIRSHISASYRDVYFLYRQRRDSKYSRKLSSWRSRYNCCDRWRKNSRIRWLGNKWNGNFYRLEKVH